MSEKIGGAEGTKFTDEFTLMERVFNFIIYNHYYYFNPFITSVIHFYRKLI
jgi:hypothetical protein